MATQFQLLQVTTPERRWCADTAKRSHLADANGLMRIGVMGSGPTGTNVWMLESSMSANVGTRCQIYRLQPEGTATLICTIDNTTEVGTTNTLITGSATPTSTAFKKGDCIGALFSMIGGGGTLAAGFTAKLTSNGDTSGIAGDSYVTFTETISTTDVAPLGSPLYLSNTLSDRDTASNPRYYKAQIGGTAPAAYDLVTNTAAGPLSPIRQTVSAGGDGVIWSTAALQAQTIPAGQWDFKHDFYVSAATSNVTMQLVIRQVNSGGSTVATIATAFSGGAAIDTQVGSSSATAAVSWRFATNDIALSANDRLEIEISYDDALINTVVTFGSTTAGANMVSGRTITHQFNGATSGALTAPATILEQPGGPVNYDEDVITTIAATTTIVTGDTETVTTTVAVATPASDTVDQREPLITTATVTSDVIDAIVHRYSEPLDTTATATTQVTDQADRREPVTTTVTATTTISEAVTWVETLTTTATVDTTQTSDQLTSGAEHYSETVDTTITASTPASDSVERREPVTTTITAITSLLDAAQRVETLTTTGTATTPATDRADFVDTVSTTINASTVVLDEVTGHGTEIVDTLATVTSTLTDRWHARDTTPTTVTATTTLGDAASRYELLATTITATTTITDTVTVVGGLFKVWNGTTWMHAPVKVWTGTTWQESPVKFWDGAQWQLSK
jgi:hypothetical protein